jgi:hypothetical protein
MRADALNAAKLSASHEFESLTIVNRRCEASAVA